MYLLNWNETQTRIEGSLGGRITFAEAKVFVDDLTALHQKLQTNDLTVRIDRSRVSKLDDGVEDLLSKLTLGFLKTGVNKVTTITKTDAEATHLINLNLQATLEGSNEVLALAQVA